MSIANSKITGKALRFAFSGAFVTMLHVTIAVALVHSLLASPPMANALAFICATAASYFLNTLWSFSARLHARTFRRFIAVSVVGMFLAISVSWFAQQMGYGYLEGIVAVAVTVPVSSFLMHHFWTYR